MTHLAQSTHPTHATSSTGSTDSTGSTHPQRPPRTGRSVRIGAVYDLVVALAFTTPWTARLAIDAIRGLHSDLGLPGEAPGAFGPEHLLFVTFFGVVVTMWAVVRLVRGDAVTALADTVGRAAFALLMTYALASGATPVLVVFLVVEVGFLLAQGWELLRARRAGVLRLRETMTV